MYYYIKGILAAKGENYMVVETGGIGYIVYTPVNDIEKAGPTGSDITVYTYLNVREDAMELYGFITEEERKLFMQLISVSGVGPKAGLAVLSVSEPSKIMTAIATGDEKLITRAQGVGPKAAQRIILELKDKVDAVSYSKNNFENTESESVITDSRAEALSALVVLGYSSAEARAAVLKLDADLSVEDMIKQALSKLM